MAGSFRFVQLTYNIMVQFFGGFETILDFLNSLNEGCIRKENLMK
jgi:hypothetical protein